jgi:hypothetical protein
MANLNVTIPFALAGFLLAGCAGHAELDIMINESPQGAVYIERIPDPKFQAAHPIKLEKEVIARTLRGIYVRSESSTLQTVFSSETKQERAFSDGDVAYLAPHITTALTQAVADQRVGFRVMHPAPLIKRSNQGGAGVGSSDPLPGAGMETTEGNLYAYGTSLNVTLTMFRHRPERPDTINMPNRRMPDDTGLKLTDISFYPPDARRPESFQPSKLLGEPLFTTLVIDYQLLAKLPSSLLTPPSPQAAEGDKSGQPPKSAAPAAAVPPSTEEAVREQKTLQELESLKEEMQKLRRQMEEQQEEMEQLKAKPKKKQKDER